MEHPKSDYKEYPKTLAPDDFWGQVRRTVHGVPVSEGQISMIVNAIKTGLELDQGDVLLDLACGNGALSRYLFDSCGQFLGVDHSEYLIEVAKRNFEILPNFEFRVGEVSEYVRSGIDPTRFTKVLSYGSFPFFTADGARTVLQGLSDRFVNIRKVFIGNLPDKERAHLFYPLGTDYSSMLSDPVSQIGIWRSRDEMEDLALETGWKDIRFQSMPQEFYAAHYRYDMILQRGD
ncbi:class I SAM-dependent methyltransferase [Alicyclobacillus tolerans]|uniref:class I SAM-dependent methyltransferase n=1 Tax=Alicyclobacillus tolerans TaxID=90970 RepID=UPI001F2441C4|nr:class I SAM-dependent methyltransferase [Alicyclobacillus tolerans]MCF8567764.1 class I SAM-dependent methyltransferase [Alicyclobacillus tolerans]